MVTGVSPFAALARPCNSTDLDSLQPRNRGLKLKLTVRAGII